jgi:hypothetical protein
MVYPVYLLEPLAEASSVFLVDGRRRSGFRSPTPSINDALVTTDLTGMEE